MEPPESLSGDSGADNHEATRARMLAHQRRARQFSVQQQQSQRGSEFLWHKYAAYRKKRKEVVLPPETVTFGKMPIQPLVSQTSDLTAGLQPEQDIPRPNRPRSYKK